MRVGIWSIIKRRMRGGPVGRKEKRRQLGKCLWSMKEAASDLGMEAYIEWTRCLLGEEYPLKMVQVGGVALTHDTNAGRTTPRQTASQLW